MPGDLTDRGYWQKRQQDCHKVKMGAFRAANSEWLEKIEPFLKEYENGRFLELGCCPGYASSMICRTVNFMPEGVDFSPDADLYLNTMAAAGIKNAVLHKCDFREFTPLHPFDIVSSFGLIEHFNEVDAILDYHHNLLRPNGLCVVVIPNFRGLQYCYHYVFDKTDLLRHNTSCMHVKTFIDYAKRNHHEIKYIGYAGKMRFWNVETGSSFSKRTLAKLFRVLALICEYFLPAGNSKMAPWIVYVGKRQPS